MEIIIKTSHFATKRDFVKFLEVLRGMEFLDYKNITIKIETEVRIE